MGGGRWTGTVASRRGGAGEVLGGSGVNEEGREDDWAVWLGGFCAVRLVSPVVLHLLPPWAALLPGVRTACSLLLGVSERRTVVKSGSTLTNHVHIPMLGVDSEAHARDPTARNVCTFPSQAQPCDKKTESRKSHGIE
jgi:hypothetical protein